ncbi:MAG: hypothetical protein ACTHNY_04350 [Solirubrobacterales bacterium]
MLLLSALLVATAACAGGCGGGGDKGTASPAADRGHQRLGEIDLRGVRSGDYDATFFVDNETKRVAVQWGAEGPFRRSGDKLETETRWEDAGLDGLTLGTLLVLDDEAILGSGGKSYRVPAPTPGATAGCQAALEEVDFATLVQNLRVKPEPTLEITKIEGTLRLDALLEALDRLTAPSACGSLLRQAGLSAPTLEALETQVKSTFKKSEATFTLNEDHVLTGLSLGIWIETAPPKPEEIDGILTFSLSGINEVGKLKAAPADAEVEEASKAQRSKVEGWIGLANAVVGALAGPAAS